MNAAEINALPERVRKYIAALETECDPAGTIRENFRLREENIFLRAECLKLWRSLKRYLRPTSIPSYDPIATKQRAAAALAAADAWLEGGNHADPNGLSDEARARNRRRTYNISHGRPDV